jgi:hypothetical protein
MLGAIGHVENGTIQLSERVDWSEGQRVLVIALPPSSSALEAPPAHLLEEDAREFAVRGETLNEINRSELG